MNAKFFGNSLFGGEFFVKDFPLSDKNPDSNILKLSFQAIGNNLVITGRTHDGRTVTVFGVADTSSVTFDVNNQNGSYTHENENLTWEWEDNILNIYVSTYGFLKAVVYDDNNKEVVYPVKIEKYESVSEEEIVTEKEKILVVFPNNLKDEEIYKIKLLYSYNSLDVTSTVGNASLRNVGINSGNIPIIELNGMLNWKTIPFISNVYEIKNPYLNLKNGNFQKINLSGNIDFLIDSKSNFRNGEKLILQIQNNGYKISVNGIEIDRFHGKYNLTIVKTNDAIQYWGKQEVKEIK